MKFAYLVMFELRSLPKTIDDLYKRIIDYYDADVFVLCQSHFEDDNERIKLFSRKLKKAELYTKPHPDTYFKNAINYENHTVSEGNWKFPQCAQIYINNGKYVDFIKPYVNDYDYFIMMRVDIATLFDFPPPVLFENIPNGAYSFHPEYCREWGGSGMANFVHRSYILTYLGSTCKLMYDKNHTEIISEESPGNFNQEKFTVLANKLYNVPISIISDINYYYTVSSLNDYTTWAPPVEHMGVLCKYPNQYNNAISALEKWNNGWRWCLKNGEIALAPPGSSLVQFQEHPVFSSIRFPSLTHK